MASFGDREKFFEEKFRHDKELQFKVTARRNKLLGLWAAEQMGISGSEAETYAKDVVMSDFEKPGDDDVVEKVLKDFQARGIAMHEHRLRKEMDSLLDIARRQIMADETK